MLYSYGLYGYNNRPYNEYYLNCGYRSTYSKNNNNSSFFICIYHLK